MADAAQVAGHVRNGAEARNADLRVNGGLHAREAAISDIRSLRRAAEAEITGLAWPTIILSTAALGIFLTDLYLAATGAMPVWAAALLNIVCFFVGYTGLHEATHRNLHGHVGSMRWINDAFGVALGCMLLYPYSLHNFLHITHHANTNDPDKDPDYWMNGHTPARIILRGLLLPGHYWAFMFATRGREPGAKKFYLRLALEISPAILIAAALIASGAWGTLLVAWIIALDIGSLALGVCFDWIVHHPHDDRTLIGGSRVFNVRKPLPRALLNAAHLFQNYHLIHHIHPRTPFYRCGHVFRRSEEFLRSQGARIVDL
ncbi:MAG: fatty acid desaturase [Parvularculaceae bacterium]